MTLGRYVHTMRHMKPVQVYRRVWYRLYRPRPDGRPAPPLRPRTGVWIPPCRRAPSLLGPSRFRFLNVERELRWPQGWNDRSIDQLWLYNLHYFEDLVARDAAQRTAWHAELIARWVQDNPPFLGKGWDPYPLSLRIANWIKYELDGGMLPPAARDSLALSVRYLTQRIEYHLLGNHLLANAKALVLAGTYFSGPEADAWLNLGLELLSEQLPEQILADGAHFELSPMYHSIILEDLLDLINLAQTYRDRIAAATCQAWCATAQSMRSWLAAMRMPDGAIALFNDAAHEIASSPAEIDEYATRLQLPKVEIPCSGLTLLASSGYARLQNEQAVLIADVGEIGPAYLPGHGHADVLTFELSIAGRRLIVNSGTSVYYGNDAQRQRERSTSAHNTVEVDGADSSVLWGNFRVAQRAHPLDLVVEDRGAAGFYVACSHDGYTRLAGSPVVRRSWHLMHNALQIQDSITGSYRRATARFHFHPDVEAADNSIEAKPVQLAQDNLLVRLSAPNRQVSWTPATYHPQFGWSVPNRCWCVDVPRPGTATNLEWTTREQGER